MAALVAMMPAANPMFELIWMGIYLLAIAALVAILIARFSERYLTRWPEQNACSAEPEPGLRWIPLNRLPSRALCAFFESDDRAHVILTNGGMVQVDRLADGTIAFRQVG